MLEQRQHVADDGVEVDRRPLRRIGGVGTRQREQAVDDARGAERLLLDLLEQLGARIARVGLLEQHLRVARDAGERRVDLVRDARGEQAERGHLLGDAQLLFELRALGDVLEDDDGARLRRRADDRLQRNHRDVDQHARVCRCRRARPAACGRASCPGGLSRERRAERFDEMRIEEPLERLAERIGARDAVEPFERLVPADHTIVEARRRAGHRRATRGCSR